MRVCEKNRQVMYYSLPNGTRPKYERDEHGDIKYITIDGKRVPVKAGGIEPSFSKPVKFEAKITANLNEMHAVSYGVDQSSIYSEIMLLKDQIPLKYGMKVWRKNPIKYLISEKDGEPDPDSADYTVKGLLDEYINYDWILLQRNDS